MSEPRDTNPRALAVIAGLLVVSLCFSSFAIALLYRAFSIDTQSEKGSIGVPLPWSRKEFPNPQLQIYPPEDLAKFRYEEDEILNGYRWVDRKSGVVQIPIQQAMEITAKRGDQPLLGSPGLPVGPTWIELMQQRAKENAERTNKP